MSVSSFEDFVKSPHDKCNYRLITLPNSLQACLVSEPGLEKVSQSIHNLECAKFLVLVLVQASAALDVHIGTHTILSL